MRGNIVWPSRPISCVWTLWTWYFVQFGVTVRHEDKATRPSWHNLFKMDWITSENRLTLSSTKVTARFLLLFRELEEKKVWVINMHFNRCTSAPGFCSYMQRISPNVTELLAVFSQQNKAASLMGSQLFIIHVIPCVDFPSPIISLF